MHARITLLASAVEELRRQLRLDRAARLELPAGLRRDRDGLELIAPAAGLEDSPRVRVFLLPEGVRGRTHLTWRASGALPSPFPSAEVALREDRGCSAALFSGGEVHPVAEVLLAGARMERWRPVLEPPELLGDVPASGARSRYAGALGGPGVLARLAALSAAVVGCSRLGTLLAVALGRAGLSRLVLVDPDLLEEHGADATECFPADVGRAKVHAAARYLREIAPETRVLPLARPVQHPDAYALCAASDLVVSAPDRGDARLLAAVAARAHHRVHLDVGTGVFRAGEELVAGADVRLIVPGDGCLLCRGGLDLARRGEPDFRRQRAGSLRSLNQVATGQAMLLLERLVAGTLASSTFMRIEVDAAGRLRAASQEFARGADCALCAAVAGRGDLATGRPHGA